VPEHPEDVDESAGDEGQEEPLKPEIDLPDLQGVPDSSANI